MASQSNATQSYTCALTGSLISTNNDNDHPIVTPSGYICSRKLLLTKLSENGGRDPFDTERSLDESSLIELATTNNNNNATSGGVGVGVVAPPRPPNATSLPSLLSLISSEFDTTLLELYDTRKALEETRRELSSALYQNDAAVRVVARLVKERDEARGALEEFLAAGGVGSGGGAAAAGDVVVKRSEKRGRNETTTVTSTTVEQDDNGVDGEVGEAPSSKKARGDAGSNSTDLTKIPQDTLSIMISTWTTLSKNRRLITKKSKRSSEVITKHETLLGGSNEGQLSGNENKKVNVTKSNCKAGILCLTKVGTSCHYNNNDGENDEYIVSGGHDKQAIVYNVTSGQILATLRGAGGDITSVSGMIVNEGRMLVVTGSADGVVRLYSVPFGGGGDDDDVQLLGSEQVGSSGGEGGDIVLPVSAIVHPSSNLEDGATIIVGGSDGSVNVFKSVPSGLKKITHLKSSEDGSSVAFSSGCLHPDGLIYAAGTTDGKVLIYDLKTQAVAGTLQGHDGNPINFITISENGYHVATSSSSSSAESPIHIWDLRKLKLSATITPHEGAGTVTSLAFDPMGLYLAYSGAEATKICVVKDWDRVVGTLSKTKTGGKKNATPPSCGGVVWGGKGLDDEGGSVWVAAGCDGEKPIRFWGVE